MSRAKRVSSFLVGTSSDPREVRRAIVGLRAMARMGKVAERALAEIGEKGHYSGRAPWIRKRGSWLDLHVSRLPTRPEMTREGIPGYGRPAVSLDSVHELEKVGGARYPVYAVSATMACYAPDGWETRKVRIGRLRLNTKLGTFFPSLPSLEAGDGVEDRKQKCYSVSLSRDVVPKVSLMCRVLAENAAGRRLGKDPRCAVFSRRMQSWLEEDGHGASVLEELREFAQRHRAVQHVMDR